ncbi:ABC transporter permease subunit [Nocardia salmonicida]|uniref:ABC transporter permease subunit n=1 Tax=Nocardia salmonicida TaxID=53431 RepID=UPI00340BC678
MTEIWRFAALGLGAGALYALAAIGLVLVYRGSGVVNFAQGAMGMVGAYTYFEAHQEHGLSQPTSVLLGVLASALLGALFHVLVLRRMHGASALAKIVATLALLVVLQSTAVLRYGALPKWCRRCCRSIRSRSSAHRSARTASTSCSSWSRWPPCSG